MDDNEYQCGHCSGIFGKAWTDEEMNKEATDIYGKEPKDWKGGGIVLCDDCFNLIHLNDYPEFVERAKQNI